MHKPLKTLSLVLLAMVFHLEVQAQTFNSQDYQLKVTKVFSGLKNPWSFLWLDPEQILVSERNGVFKIINTSSQKVISAYRPKLENYQISQSGQGGLLDLLQDPEVPSLVYATASIRNPQNGNKTTGLLRLELEKNAISSSRLVFVANAWETSGVHFGSRLITDGKQVFMSIGDRGDRFSAQNPANHKGSLLALQLESLRNSQKLVPAEIYSFGHRNPQGLFRDSRGGEIFAHEHGPQGGDELNLIKQGSNYGWPITTYGKEYVTGRDIAPENHPNTEQPLFYWVPSIAPSGLVRYRGDEFAKWQDDFLLGSLKFGFIQRLSLKNGEIKVQENLLEGLNERIRDIRQAPGGGLYFITDSRDGSVYQISRH